MHTLLIQPRQLQALQAAGESVLVFDCSSDLMNPGAGRQQFLERHLPGARHAHLDQDLSAHHGPAVNGGRHPLPHREHFAAWLASQGLHAGQQVVVYDRNGVNYCGRLWWMLKWVGHEAVAVLDGGLQAWEQEGLPLESGPAPDPTPGDFQLGPALRVLTDADTVLRHLGRPAQTLIDARAGARFRGETEPLDPVAGHIPGALNRPFASNLDASGRFKAPDVLRAEFEALLAGRDPVSVVHHCGSGVSAVPNLLAMEIAGLGTTALFAGSWSEWCSDPTRPFAQG